VRFDRDTYHTSPTHNRIAARLGLRQWTHVFGAGEQSNAPNFSSIDRPWVASEGGEYLLPASGIGPVTYDHAHPVMVCVPVAGGAVAETALRVADVNNPNLKWVVDALKKIQPGGACR
jgi:hypothetical protein